jgi:ABC-type polysaccharide/polyol phosphate export permease
MKNRAWGGDYVFLLSNLMQKDFKIRYRNMSLGVFWSLLNPLVTMGVLTFVITQIFKNTTPNYPVRLLCGLVPFNFFSFAWGVGTNSIVDGSNFVKRVAIPREIIPIASVLSNCLHILIQIGLLLFMTVAFGNPVNVNWLWLPVIWGLFIIFVCGLTLMTSALNVFVRDVRYLVESFNAVLFWLVPIFYSFEIIPPKYLPIFVLNPVSAMVFALRRILVEGGSPPLSLIRNLTLVSFGALLVGFIVFRQLRRKFYDYL